MERIRSRVLQTQLKPLVNPRGTRLRVTALAAMTLEIRETSAHAAKESRKKGRKKKKKERKRKRKKRDEVLRRFRLSAVRPASPLRPRALRASFIFHILEAT